MEMENRGVRSFRPGAIAAGVILLGLGAAMFLDTTGATDFHLHLGRLIGPLFLISIGTSMLLDRSALVCGVRSSTVDGEMPRRHRRRGGAASGVWLIGIGAWLLAVQSHVFGLTYHNSWPLFLVLSGITVVIRGFK